VSDQASVTTADFEAVRRLLYEHSAIALEAGKEYLVESRLNPLVHKNQLKSIGELLAHARTPSGIGLHRQIIEAMVTTETSFFRDHVPFEALRKTVLPDLISRRSNDRRLHIWCAASASGQEPYSVALLLKEHFPELAEWRVLLMASDLSREILDRAREGKYSQIEVNRGLPASLLIKYFEQQGTFWQLTSDIRRMVEFQELNLAKAWPSLPPMDLVLIRNVMIYFDVDTKKAILGRLARVLRPDGYLLLGGSETTFNLDPAYRRVEPLRAGVYQYAN
jgi:chemotaxis protein methyltransferase CheR